MKDTEERKPTMRKLRVPTAAELYALEQQAQRARSLELARLAGEAARWIKGRLKGLAASRPADRGVRHA